MREEDALAANLANWEARVPVHEASYRLDPFIEDPAHLSDVVRYDASALGRMAGLRVAHLQCHLGADTISLARLGAEVVGLDFSPSALAVARDLAERVGWVPSMARWAQVVAELLAPGGRLYLRDGHPVLMTLDETRGDEQLVVTHPYFGGAGPQRWEDDSSYVGEPGAVANPVYYEWHHPLSEIVQAVIDAGLAITRLHEGDGLDWGFAPWMETDAERRYHFPAEQRALIPTEFTLEAIRPPGAAPVVA